MTVPQRPRSIPSSPGSGDRGRPSVVTPGRTRPSGLLSVSSHIKLSRWVTPSDARAVPRSPPTQRGEKGFLPARPVTPSGGPRLSGDPTIAETERPIDVGPVRLGRARPLARDQWGGLPPVGERPVLNRRHYLYEVVGVFGAWLVIWAAYRWAREASGADDTVLGPVLSVLAPVIVSFSLPYIWWRYRRRERGIPFLVTRRNTFSSILVACIAVGVFFVFFFISYPVLIALMGVEVEGDLTFWANWRAHGGRGCWAPPCSTWSSWARWRSCSTGASSRTR